MDPARWRRVDQILSAAFRCASEERPAFLAEACEGDEGLRREVEELLAADAAGHEDWIEPIVANSHSQGDAYRDGVIGHYTLGEKIGQGGMGEVYAARRTDGTFERQVAIKLVSAMAGGERIRRLRSEQEILARLEHPNIARLYDAGTTEDGRPYLVMEYIDGLPIDRYCDHHRLSVTDRVRLVEQLCLAVEEAHRNLLIHRDIKPDNILVAGDGTPKLLDFGLAKLLDPGAPEDGCVQSLRWMTPWYASPEQVAGEALTVSSDIYSLGVLLYVLLLGVLPYRDRQGAFAEAIRETPAEPPLSALARIAAGKGLDPSGQPVALETLCGARSVEAKELGKRLGGDLGTILLKTLSKEPERRYGHARELADDLARWRTRRPVKARRDSWPYRLGRFAARHRLAVAMGTAALLAGFVAAGLFWGQSLRLSKQRAIALQEQASAGAALDFLVDVFSSADPTWADGKPPSASEILANGAVKVRRELAGQPALQARLFETIGQVYTTVGLHAEAEPLLLDALALRRDLGTGVELARSLWALGQLRFYQGRYEDSEALLQESCSLYEATAPESLGALEAQTSLAWVNSLQGRNEQALELYRVALAGLEAIDPESLEVATALDEMAGVEINRRNMAEAERLLRRSEAIRQARSSPGNPDYAATRLLLARTLAFRGEAAAALALAEETIEALQNAVEEGHPKLILAWNELAVMLESVGEKERGLAMHEELVVVKKRMMGDRHPKVAVSVSNVGVALIELGRPAEAVPHLLEAVEIRRAVLGPENAKTGFSLSNLGEARLRAGQLDAAEANFQEAMTILSSTLGEDSFGYSRPLAGMARLEVQRGRLEVAEAMLRRAIALRLKRLQPGQYRIISLERFLAKVLHGQGRETEALALVEDALAAIGPEPKSDQRTEEERHRLRELQTAWGAR